MSIKTFEDARNFLSNIPNIGCGGCGIAALAMKRWLKKFQDVEAEIIYGFNMGSEYYYNNNSDALQKNDFTITTACSHAGIKTNVVMDCNVIWRDDQYSYYLTMPEEFAVSSINNGGWNSDFKRDKYVHWITSNLQIDLSDVKIN